MRVATAGTRLVYGAVADQPTAAPVHRQLACAIRHAPYGQILCFNHAEGQPKYRRGVLAGNVWKTTVSQSSPREPDTGLRVTSWAS